MNSSLRIPRTVALAAIAALIAASALTSFAESYRGLFLWSHEHGVPGVWSVLWPLQVDVFIAVGELALFVALVDRWAARSRTAAWTVVLAGLAVSVAGNVGHVAVHSLADRLTAAVPPLAAAAALAVGLGVLKRVVGRAGQQADDELAELDAEMAAELLERSPAAQPQAVLAGPHSHAASRPARPRRATVAEVAKRQDRALRAARRAVAEGRMLPSERELVEGYQINRRRAGEVLARVRAELDARSGNGHKAGLGELAELTPTP